MSSIAMKLIKFGILRKLFKIKVLLTSTVLVSLITGMLLPMLIKFVLPTAAVLLFSILVGKKVFGEE